MRKLIPSYIRIPAIFFIIAGLTEYFVESGDQPAFMEKPVVLVFLLLVLVILIAIESIVSAMENVLFQSLDEEAKARYLAKQKEPSKLVLWLKNTYTKLVGTKPIEEEGEIILDHNYDGIKELDNNLPPWWVYSFYITIIFGIIYMVRYHVLNADDQFVEFEIEYAEAQRAIEEYKKNAKDLVGVNTVELLADASDLKAGEAIFVAKCAVCHKADGGGGIGPNLTDKHWILGGGIKNVFKTISEGGRDGKGMVSWRTEGLKPFEMAQVASYVLQFEGTSPAEPKAAEGEIWVDETAAEEAPSTESEETTEDTEADVITEGKTIASNK
ncbi:cytochrome C oxidase subunit III [Winogradskyella sp. PC-19]|uniref:cbb3-type cytochrome c oxidase N-terminal domain-containing protein n=1 Tax=unclassified Winogradskyella TaxID=2615021 RepID=UPI000B3D3864|nr:MULTISPECIES: cbb3-type cytochrome c oxidase N-terminal domain-containing protein [unclassified Winogradskyella]ARV08912.1 cytochrome C oxidase subunit III [Winogradskyella sp. PC-19]RZN78459.1 MAG: c-type cytochrome [Winogradskyella sp.]